MSACHAVTQVLREWTRVNQQALEELTPLYPELRQLTAAYLPDERPDQTPQPTALVHEAYLRLVDQQHASWHSRSHFFATAAHQILVDHGRRHQAGKRAGHKVSPGIRASAVRFFRVHLRG